MEWHCINFPEIFRNSSGRTSFCPYVIFIGGQNFKVLSDKNGQIAGRAM